MAFARSLAAGCGLGAGLMFMFDPQSGRRRRAVARDKLFHYARAFGSFFTRGARDLEMRTQGSLHDWRARLKPGTVPNDVLIERVRARAGRVVLHPKELFVTAEDGTVTLRGRVRPVERALLVAQVRLVPGVKEVRDNLELGHFDEQGNPLTPFFRRSWKPATRFVASTAAGLGLAGLALKGLRA